MALSEQEQELISLTQQLLDAIAAGDWQVYCELCDPTLTAFEPEGRGHLIAGMEFHQFYFDLPQSPGGSSPHQTTISSPHVRFLGDDVGVVAYVRLVQRIATEGQPVTVPFEETRIWQRQHGQWKHVHFHRSRPS